MVAIAQAERRLDAPHARGRDRRPGAGGRRDLPGQGSPRLGPGGAAASPPGPGRGLERGGSVRGGAAGRRPACLRACESEAAARSGASRGGAADTRHLFP